MQNGPAKRGRFIKQILSRRFGGIGFLAMFAEVEAALFAFVGHAQTHHGFQNQCQNVGDHERVNRYGARCQDLVDEQRDVTFKQTAAACAPRTAEAAKMPVKTAPVKPPTP